MADGFCRSAHPGCASLVADVRVDGDQAVDRGAAGHEVAGAREAAGVRLDATSGVAPSRSMGFESGKRHVEPVEVESRFV